MATIVMTTEFVALRTAATPPATSRVVRRLMGALPRGAKLCGMSNLEREAVPSLCGGRGFVVAEPVRELLSPRKVKLGESSEVRRLLPNLGRRMVGAWCFVDHYGPDDIADEPGMQVAPHPHMGLQTVSWLHQGEVLHRDSTGSLQTIPPRDV